MAAVAGQRHRANHPPAILSLSSNQKLRCPEFVTQDLQALNL